MLVAISAAGVFATDDAGTSWTPANAGLRSPGILPEPEVEVGHCVHKLASHPARPETVFMQKHWDVMRSDDGGASWREISGDLPSDFGGLPQSHCYVNVLRDAMAVDALDPCGVYVGTTGGQVYASPDGGDSWSPVGRWCASSPISATCPTSRPTPRCPRPWPPATSRCT